MFPPSPLSHTGDQTQNITFARQSLTLSSFLSVLGLADGLTEFRPVVLNPPNFVTLRYSSSYCGEPNDNVLVIATS